MSESHVTLRQIYRDHIWFIEGTLWKQKSDEPTGQKDLNSLSPPAEKLETNDEKTGENIEIFYVWGHLLVGQ